MFTDRITDNVLKSVTPLLDDLKAQMEHMQQDGRLAGENEMIAELKRLESERTSG